MRVHVWWNEDGQQQEWLNVTLGSSITIKRDPGSQVQIRVFQNDDPLSSVDFWCVDFNNSIQKKVTSSQWYVDFLDCVGSGDAQVWAYVKNLQGRVEILAYNIVPQEPDLTVSNIRYPCQ